MSNQPRRDFLQQAGLGTLATAAWNLGPAATRAAGANERLVVGVIGPGGMGSSHVRQLVGRQDVRVAYVCEVDAKRLAAAARIVQDATGQAPTAVKDLRQVLDDKAVDAVWIATPDHWHAPAAILACDAGKHVYVEKPCSHNLREGRLMVEAARRNKRVVQVGTQSRSTEHVPAAMQRAPRGRDRRRAGGQGLEQPAPRQHRPAQPGDPPEHLDYDLWLGPAPACPYQSNLLPGIWRWWYDFGVRRHRQRRRPRHRPRPLGTGRRRAIRTPSRPWAASTSSTTTSSGRTRSTCVFEYAGAGPAGRNKQLIFEQRIWSPYFQEGYENGDAFYGTKGMMILGKQGGWKVILEGNKPGPEHERHVCPAAPSRGFPGLHPQRARGPTPTSRSGT